MIEIMMIRVTVVNVKHDTASNNLSHFPLFVLLLVIAVVMLQQDTTDVYYHLSMTQPHVRGRW